MPGKRLPLTRLDNEVLKSFFDDIKYEDETHDYYKLNDNKKRINDIMGKTLEHPNRLEKRVKRLKDLGFLHEFPEIGNSNSWFVTYQAMFYMLSRMNGYPEITKFIKKNAEVSHFAILQKIIDKDEAQLVIMLIEEIKSCVRSHLYKRIMKIVQDWYDDADGLYLGDWGVLVPGARTRRYNHVTKKDEII